MKNQGWEEVARLTPAQSAALAAQPVDPAERERLSRLNADLARQDQADIDAQAAYAAQPYYVYPTVPYYAYGYGYGYGYPYYYPWVPGVSLSLGFSRGWGGHRGWHGGGRWRRIAGRTTGRA